MTGPLEEINTRGAFLFSGAVVRLPEIILSMSQTGHTSAGCCYSSSFFLIFISKLFFTAVLVFTGITHISFKKRHPLSLTPAATSVPYTIPFNLHNDGLTLPQFFFFS